MKNSGKSPIVTKVDKSSTHLFFDLSDIPEFNRRAGETPWLGLLRDNIEKEAKKLMSLKTSPYDPIWDEFGTAGRTLQFRGGILAFAGHLLQNEKYLIKAKDIFIAAAEQTEPTNRSDWRGHLQVADASFAFALGYDWLRPVLSKKEDDYLIGEIYKYGKNLFEERAGWGYPGKRVTSCNHNAVHFGGLGLCALLLGNQSGWLELAIERVRLYLENFVDETGYGTEGHQYTGYGLHGSLPFSLALKRLTGEDIMADYPILEEVAEQVLWKLLPFDGRMLAMNDNWNKPSDVTMLYPAMLYKKSEQLWAWLESQKSKPVDSRILSDPHEGLRSPFAFIFMKEHFEAKRPTDENYPLGKYFESGRVFLRSSWNSEEAGHVSLTSGVDYHHGHNHSDEGAVTFAALGEIFLHDPERQAIQSQFHTTLNINGAEQRENPEGKLKTYREDKQGAFVWAENTEAYENIDFLNKKAFMAYSDRKIYFVRKPVAYLIWRDDAAFENYNDIEGIITARFITHPDNRIEEKGKDVVIHGARTGARCLIRVYSGEEQIAVRDDKMENETFVRNNEKYPCTKWMKRVSAKTIKNNPRYINIAFPFKEENDFPEITIHDNKKLDEICCIIKYKSQGNSYQDIFVLSLKNIEMNHEILPN
jgi:hypothetical protein